VLAVDAFVIAIFLVALFLAVVGLTAFVVAIRGGVLKDQKRSDED